MRTTTVSNLAALALAVSLLAACDLQGPIDQQSAEAQKAQEHNQLRDAINQPIDKAKNAGAPIEQADKDREKALEESGG
jgi:predicted small lipoprotein YifL